MSPSLSAEGPTSAENWRFTWEAQSHTSVLRMLLFNPNIEPSTWCRDLKLSLVPELSLLTLSFLENDSQVETSMQVPIPRVLVDPEPQPQVRAFDDHIEVKLVLLLPVDHPIVSDMNSILKYEENGAVLHPLSVDSDLKELSCMKEVHFYCRNCSSKLTKDLRYFEEMPSVNWRDVADNWFGNCCCSFGGVSERLVEKYAKSYSYAPGLCLLNPTSVLICKDDLLCCKFPDASIRENHESDPCSLKENGLRGESLNEHLGKIVHCGGDQEGMLNAAAGVNFPYTEGDIAANKQSDALGIPLDDGSLSTMFPALQIEEKIESINEKHQIGCCHSEHSSDTLGTSSMAQMNGENAALPKNQKVFLDGYLGNGFMVRSSGLSSDIQWIELLCPDCSCLIGAYPCHDDNVPLDGGVRLFKCCISTCTPDNAFRYYTLEKLFASQLLESAEDELSYKTVVRDIQTKSPLLQVVLLNPNSWGCAGCLPSIKPVSKITMYPNIKVLFSPLNEGMNCDARNLEDWVRENQADEIHMFPSQVQELIRVLELANSLYPPSCTSLQGLFLSIMRR